MKQISEWLCINTSLEFLGMSNLEPLYILNIAPLGGICSLLNLGPEALICVFLPWQFAVTIKLIRSLPLTSFSCSFVYFILPLLN